MALITIDVGGSNIKYSLFSEGKLGEVKSKQTPIISKIITAV